ncbi:MAG: M48 family metalloprotease [Actinomycetes bacterium]
MYEQIASNKWRSVAYLSLFFLVWCGIGVALGAIYSPSGRRVPALVVGGLIAGIAAALGIVYTLTSGTSLVLSVSGARPADPVQYKELHDIVEALAIGDGLPKPAVYVIDDPHPNAFATGTSHEKAAITATTGLLQLMNREELEGVIGHEMSHIKNYDVRLILIVTTLIGMAGLLASLIWRMAFYGRARNKGDVRVLAVVLAAGVLLSVVAFVVGPLIKLGLSRRRESLADASGVELTRNPIGLIHALQKLEHNDQPFAKMNHATAAMCIDDPLTHHSAWMRRLFDTHPPIEERIAALQRIYQVQEL